MTQATKEPPTSLAEGGSIRPFQFEFTDDELIDLKRRVASTKFPDGELVKDVTQGVKLDTMRKLADYWARSYNWRKFEQKLKNLPHFVTEIDGCDIHFIHVRSKHKNVLPLILTHGWPGSVVEFLKVIDPLTNPTAYGGKESDAFDVVIPSIPGYGFSGKPTSTGWDPVRIAKAWTTLMKRLGYKKFVAQGGDWGDAITEQMGLLGHPELIGIHTNMAATVPDKIEKSLHTGEGAPKDLTAEELNAWNQLDFFYKTGLSYALEMNSRPQTLYGLADSPIGLAAWILDHDDRSLKLISRVFDGKTEGLSKDDILDNITFYWLTNTAISSARLYWENKLPFFAPKGVKIPTAVSVFPDEIYAAPKSWAEKAFPNLIYYNKLKKGGHFAAWEQPELFTKELRAAFKSLR